MIAPVVLGCCHDSPRCLLCNPPPRAPAPETVAALLAHYAAERASVDDTVLAGFFGGPAPSDALLDAIGGTPFTARVRPDLLTRAEASRLLARGAESLELDALTFDDVVLKSVGRRYGARMLREQSDGLRAAGIRVGGVLAPGLPGTDHASAVRDAERAAELFDFVRIHPVLVLSRSRLRQAWADGQYRPLELGAAVTVVRSMLDVLDAAGVQVVRVGLQPGPDELGPVSAGPRHPSLRELVEARRALDHLRGALDDSSDGTHIVIRCAPGDETRTRGPKNQNVRTLRAERALASLRIVADPTLERGEWRIETVESE